MEHPELDDLLTEETAVVFLPEFDAELKDFNLRMARDIKSQGAKLVYVKVKEIAPKIISRLIGVEVEKPSDSL